MQEFYADPGSLERPVLVVGAGVAGLQAARALLKRGLQVVVLEQSEDVGGVWIRNYAGYGLQVPWENYQFPEFPYPRKTELEQYPSGEQVREYVQSYARHFDLYRHILFSCKLISLRRKVPVPPAAGPGTGPGPVAESRMSTDFHTSASAMSGANNDARRSGSASTTGFGPMAPRASAGSAATAAAGSGWGAHPPLHATTGRRSFGTVFSSSAKRLFGQLVGGGGGAQGGGVHSSASAVTMPLQDGVAAGRPAVRGAGAGAIGVADGLNWRGGGSTTEQVARTFEGGAMQQPSPVTAGAAAAERMGGASNGGGVAPSGDGPDSAGARGPVSGSAGLSGSSSTSAREHADAPDGTSNTGAGSAQAKSSTAGATVNNSSRAGSKGGNVPTTRGAAPRVPPSGAKGAARGSSPSRSGSWADARRIRRQQQRVAAAERAAAAAADGAAARRAGLAGDGWLALYEDMTTGKQYMLEVSYVVLATGLYATPFIPSIPGQELYRGLQVHSKDFTDAAVAAGKEVLVVGAGKTAADIVTELTATSQASRVTLLYRRPHWPLPRAVGPVTIKSLAYTRLISSALLPYYYDAGPGGKAAAACLTPLRKAFWIRFMAKVNQTFGVKKTMGAPDRPICQDIWYSGQVLDAVKWPDVINNPKVQARQGEVEYFTPVSAVLRDGTELQPDIVLYATGYSNQYTFLEPDVRESINVQHDGVYLYRHVLVPGLPGLAFVGAEVSTFNNILTAALQAEWLASALAGEVELPLPHAMAADVEAQMEWRRRTMPPHKLRGSSVMLYMQAYHDQLVRDMGAATHRKQPSFRHPFAECFEPYTALDYSDVFMRDPLKVAASGAALAQAAAVPTATTVAVGRATAAAALAANGTVDNGTDESNAANGATVEAAAAAVAAAANGTAGTATSPTVLGTNNASCSAAASSGAYFTSLRASNSTGAQWAPCRTSTMASTGLGRFSNPMGVHSNSNGGPTSGAGPSPVRRGGAPGATATAAASNIYTNKTIAGLAAIGVRNGMGASNVRSPPWIYSPMAEGAIAAAAALQPATQASMPNAAARTAAGATMSGSRPPLVTPQRTASFTPASAFTSAAAANAATAAQTMPPNAAATAAAAGVVLGTSPRHGGYGTGMQQQHHHNVPLDPLAPSEIDEDEPKARAVDEQDTLYSLDALPPALQAFRRTRVRSDTATRPSTGGGILDAMEEYADEYDEAAGDSQGYSDTPHQQQYRISGVVAPPPGGGAAAAAAATGNGFTPPSGTLSRVTGSGATPGASQPRTSAAGSSYGPSSGGMLLQGAVSSSVSTAAAAAGAPAGSSPGSTYVVLARHSGATADSAGGGGAVARVSGGGNSAAAHAAAAGLVMGRVSTSSSGAASQSSTGAVSTATASSKASSHRPVQRGLSLATLLLRRRNAANAVYDVSSSRIEPTSAAVNELGYRVLPPRHVEEAMAAAAAAAAAGPAAAGKRQSGDGRAAAAAAVAAQAAARRTAGGGVVTSGAANVTLQRVTIGGATQSPAAAVGTFTVPRQSSQEAANTVAIATPWRPVNAVPAPAPGDATATPTTGAGPGPSTSRRRISADSVAPSTASGSASLSSAEGLLPQPPTQQVAAAAAADSGRIASAVNAAAAAAAAGRCQAGAAAMAAAPAAGAAAAGFAASEVSDYNGQSGLTRMPSISASSGISYMPSGSTAFIAPATHSAQQQQAPHQRQVPRQQQQQQPAVSYFNHITSHYGAADAAAVEAAAAAAAAADSASAVTGIEYQSDIVGAHAVHRSPPSISASSGISYMPSGSTAFVAPTQALAVHPQPRGVPAAAQSQRQGHAHVAHPQDPRREYLQNVVEHVQGRSMAAAARNTGSGGGGATESDAPGGSTRNGMSSGLSYVPSGSSFGPQPTLQLLPHYQVNIVDNTGSASTASAFGAYNTSGSTKLGYVSGSNGAGVLYANGHAVGGANHHGNGNDYPGGGVHMPVVHERRLSGASYASSGYSYMPSCSTVVPPQLVARS